MTSRIVPLKRNPVRLAIAVGLRGAVGTAAGWTGLQVPGVLGLALLVSGAVVAAYVVLLTMVVLTARLEVRPGELSLVTAIGRRRYTLERGRITRLWIGKNRRLAVQVIQLGLMIGRGHLGGEDLAGVFSLAKVDHLVLVPTKAGRLGIAPRSEEELVEALTATGNLKSTVSAAMY